MIKLKIDVLKIPKEKLFKGKKGTWLNLVLIERPNEYSDGFISVETSKEEREAGVKGPILGNWSRVVRQVNSDQTQPPRRPPTSPPRPKEPDLDAPEDDIPF